MDSLPYCTQSRLLADLLPLKAESCHHFSPNCKEDAVLTAAGGTIWWHLEQCKLSMSQAPAPCVAPPSTSSCLHTAEKHFLILFVCPTVFSLMLTVHVLHVYTYNRGTNVIGAGEKSICLAFRGWEVLLSVFCPFEEQLGSKEQTHTGDQDEMLPRVYICDLFSAACLDHELRFG